MGAFKLFNYDKKIKDPVGSFDFNNLRYSIINMCIHMLSKNRGYRKIIYQW